MWRRFDLVAVQGEICNEVFATLHGLGGLQGGRNAIARSRLRLSQDISEEYLQARAVLSSFMSRTGSREDLDRARELFESVTRQDVNFAPGWSGLGITHLQYASHGLGGQMHVLEARRAFDKALALDPGSVESNLYRVYMLLSRGEKESARHGIESLLQTAPNDWNVHLVAGQTLRIDGMYDEALEQFNIALRLNPVECGADLQQPRAGVPVSEPARTGGRRARKGADARAEAAAAAHLARLPADAAGRSGRRRSRRSKR